MAGRVGVAHLDGGGDRLSSRFQGFLQRAKGGFAPGMIASSADSKGKIVGHLYQKRDLLQTKRVRFSRVQRQRAGHSRSILERQGDVRSKTELEHLRAPWRHDRI